MIEPFRVELLSETIADLRSRLEATRWPGGVSDSGGVPLSVMRDIARYWLETFDWPAQERAINYDRFTVQGGDWGAGIGTWLAVRTPRPAWRARRPSSRSFRNGSTSSSDG